MIKITPEQLQILEQRTLQDFEDKMADHLTQFAPEHIGGIGKPNLKRVVESGIRRAAKFGLTGEGAVRFFLELKITLGSDFDSDPMYPWASRILQATNVQNQAAQAELLYEEWERFHDAAIGKNFEHEIAAITRFLEEPFESLIMRQMVLSSLKSLYPQKYERVGDVGLHALKEKAKGQAYRHGLPSGGGGALLFGLMFVFGHGCLEDPQFAWMAGSLKETAALEEEPRLLHLFNKAATLLKKGLSLLEQG